MSLTFPLIHWKMYTYYNSLDGLAIWQSALSITAKEVQQKRPKNTAAFCSKMKAKKVVNIKGKYGVSSKVLLLYCQKHSIMWLYG